MRASRQLTRHSNLTIAQYQQGAVDFNRVFTLQDTKVAQQDAYASSQGNIALNLIGVYKALGGGWEVRLGAGQQFASPVEALPPDMADPADEGAGTKAPRPTRF